MAAVHRWDPSKNSGLPSISDITSDQFVLPLFPARHDMLPQSIAGHCDQDFITNSKPAMVEKQGQRVQYPAVDRSWDTDPGFIQLGRLSPDQIPLPNGPFPPPPQIYAESRPKAGYQYGVATGRDGDSNPMSFEDLCQLFCSLEWILEDLHCNIQKLCAHESIHSELDKLISKAARNQDFLGQVHNLLQRLKRYSFVPSIIGGAYRHAGNRTMDNRDMTSQDNLNGGKKRHRRPAPASRCHSCNRNDTPEWRRGPDGARTLCNACGLRYAKERKRKLKAQ